MSDATLVDALTALQKAKNNTSRLRILRRYASPELRTLLYLALREEPVWSLEFPAPTTMTQCRIFSDENWYHAVAEFVIRWARGELALFEAQGLLAYNLGLSTPPQREWMRRILSGRLGFPLTKQDVKKTLGG